MNDPGHEEEHKYSEHNREHDHEERVRTILEYVAGGIPLDRLDDNAFFSEPHSDAGDDAKEQADEDLGPLHAITEGLRETIGLVANHAAGAVRFVTDDSASVFRFVADDAAGRLVIAIHVLFHMDTNLGGGFLDFGRLAIHVPFVVNTNLGGGFTGGSKHSFQRFTHFDHHYPTFLMWGPF